MPNGRNRRKPLLTVAACSILAVVSVALYLVRDPMPRFLARRSAIDAVHEAGPTVVGDSRFQNVRLVAKSGLTINMSLRRQVADSLRRLPVVVILGGHLTGAEAAKVIGETPGVMIAALSYPFTGDLRPSKLTFFREIPKIRAAFLDTPPALQLAVDYLLSRSDVDSSQIEAVGVSLGAPFVTIAAAMDRRFSRVWALHGSGGSYAPLEASMRQSIPFAPLRHLSAATANVIIAGPRLAPERWVAQIAPRPFIMVNATEDERLPRPAVDALYNGASQPKEIIWMPGGHIHGDAHTIQRLVGIVLERVSGTTSN
jgi:hypothetical protein